MNEKMLTIIYKYIQQNNLLDGCENVIVGLSGGADSVCLLITLNEIIKRYYNGIKLMAVHVHHGIRDAEADRDELFSRNLCERYGVSYMCEHVDVPAMARDFKLTEEEAGRKARYDIFNRLSEGRDNWRIAVAHHSDDQAETVLMNIIRGTGLKGLCGMQPMRDNIIRPLLCISRADIESFLGQIQETYITDSTNMDNEYTRNKLRNVVVPYLKTNLNENVTAHIAHMSEELSEIDEYLRIQVDEAYNQSVEIRDRQMLIKMSTFLGYHKAVRKSLVRRVLINMSGKAKDIYSDHIKLVNDLGEAQVGSIVDVAYFIRAERKYSYICLYIKDSSELKQNQNYDASVSETIKIDLHSLEIIPEKAMTVELSGYCMVDDNGLDEIHVKSVTFSIINFNESDFGNFEDNICTKSFDYDTIKNSLFIRKRLDGDSFTVNSEGRKKKLKKELVDKKVPKEFRDKLLIIADEEVVMWVVGVRRCEDALITENTRRILRIKVNKE